MCDNIMLQTASFFRFLRLSVWSGGIHSDQKNQPHWETCVLRETEVEVSKFSIKSVASLGDVLATHDMTLLSLSISQIRNSPTMRPKKPR